MSKKNKKKGGKLTDNWIGTGKDGDHFHADPSKDRNWNKIQSIADIPHQDLPDWKEGKYSLGKLQEKKRKEKKDG